jgi:thiosulfate dehydrogenase
MLMQICHGGKKLSLRPWFVLVSAALILNACSENRAPVPHAVGSDSLSYGILIPQTALLARSWEVPHNPMKVRPSDDSALTKSITHGYELFMNTPQIALSLAGNAMSCNNCHPNGGQRDRAMPLVGIAKVFPEYNKRSGRIFSLEDRIIGCLLRSLNATGNRTHGTSALHENDLAHATLNDQTKEVRDLAAYLTWISSFAEIGKDVPWRGRNSLQPSALLPLEKLNPKLGKELYIRACSTCHGSDGQGVDVGGKRPGPLWGPNSWNDGAGAARTYTLAGMIRRWMPYLNPSLLSDEQAQHIAAYITSQPRPGFPFKNKDYLKEKIPVDAVYYKQLYIQNPLTQK